MLNGRHIMHAQKFQIRYSPVQDRILIIVTGEDAQERVFGLTRRIVKRLVPGLRGIMGDETFDPPRTKTSRRGSRTNIRAVCGRDRQRG